MLGSFEVNIDFAVQFFWYSGFHCKRNVLKHTDRHIVLSSEPQLLMTFCGAGFVMLCKGENIFQKSLGKALYLSLYLLI